MTNDELRDLLTRRIDAILARTLFVRGEDRTLLTALRGYAGAMSEADLDRLRSFFPREVSMSTHHEKLAPYADMSQALYGVKLAVAHVKNGLVDGLPVDRACAIQGAHNALGFGLSYLPHDGHAKFGAAVASSLSTEELAGQMEAAMPADGKFGADAVPWAIILPILFELLKRWLEK